MFSQWYPNLTWIIFSEQIFIFRNRKNRGHSATVRSSIRQFSLLNLQNVQLCIVLMTFSSWPNVDVILFFRFSSGPVTMHNSSFVLFSNYSIRIIPRESWKKLFPDLLSRLRCFRSLFACKEPPFKLLFCLWS